MALESGYATVSYANQVNFDIADWEELSVIDKENALSMARYFIDSKYTCSTFTEPYPDELMTANSKLALVYVQGNLYNVQDTSEMLVAKTVKAGSVTVSKEYSGRYNSSLSKHVDHYPEVTALLSEYCSLTASSNSDSLIRV